MNCDFSICNKDLLVFILFISIYFILENQDFKLAARPEGLHRGEVRRTLANFGKHFFWQTQMRRNWIKMLKESRNFSTCLISYQSINKQLTQVNL